MHKHEERYSSNIIRIHGQTPIAVIKKNSNQKGTLACTIPWGMKKHIRNDKTYFCKYRYNYMKVMVGVG